MVMPSSGAARPSRDPRLRGERAEAPQDSMTLLRTMFERPLDPGYAEAAARKAAAEMRPGSWLVSLEFKAPGLRLHAVVQREGQRPVWIYAVGREARPLRR